MKPDKAGYHLYLMYAALGAALDRWGYVEAALAAIFCAAVNPTKQEVASAALPSDIRDVVRLCDARCRTAMF